MPVNPAARFQVEEVAIRQPGTCFICRTSKGPFIATGKYHDFYMEAPNPEHDGYVYICAGCVLDMAQTLKDYGLEPQRAFDAHRSGVQEAIDYGRAELNAFANDFGNRILARYAAALGSDDSIGESTDEESAEFTFDFEGAEENPDGATSSPEQDSGTVGGEGATGLSDDSGDASTGPSDGTGRGKRSSA